MEAKLRCPIPKYILNRNQKAQNALQRSMRTTFWSKNDPLEKEHPEKIFSGRKLKNRTLGDMRIQTILKLSGKNRTLHQNFNQRPRVPWDVPDEMLKYTKSQQKFFKCKEKILRNIRKSQNYRKENVDELQNEKIKVICKKIFQMKNEMRSQQ